MSIIISTEWRCWESWQTESMLYKLKNLYSAHGNIIPERSLLFRTLMFSSESTSRHISLEVFNFSVVTQWQWWNKFLVKKGSYLINKEETVKHIKRWRQTGHLFSVLNMTYKHEVGKQVIREYSCIKLYQWFKREREDHSFMVISETRVVLHHLWWMMLIKDCGWWWNLHPGLQD